MDHRLKQLLQGLAAVLVIESIYVFIQQHTVSEHDLLTWLDNDIPFIKGWIWIYISIFPALVYACLAMEPDQFTATLKRVCLAAFVSYIGFIWLPSDYPRPGVIDDGTLYGWGYHLMHQLDGARNTFPSLHVSMTCIVVHELGQSLKGRLLTTFYAALVTASILFTKQHFIYDALGGIGVYALTIVLFLSPKRP